MRNYNIYENISLSNEGYYVAPINELETEEEKIFKDLCLVCSPRQSKEIVNVHRKVVPSMFIYFVNSFNRRQNNKKELSKFDLMLKGLLSMAARITLNDLTIYTSITFDSVGLMNISEIYDMLKKDFLRIENGELVFQNNHINTTSCFPDDRKIYKGISVVSNSCFSILENEDHSKYVRISAAVFDLPTDSTKMKVVLFKGKEGSTYDMLRGCFEFLSELGFPKPNKAKNGLSVGGYSLELLDFLKLLYSTILELLNSNYCRTGVYTEEEYQQFFNKIEQLLVRIKFSFLKYDELRNLRYDANNNFYTLVQRTSFNARIPITNFSYHVCNWIKECLENKQEVFNVCEISEDYFSRLLIHTLFDMVRLTYNDDIQNLEFLEAKDIVSNSVKNYVLSFRFVEEDGFTKVLFEDRTINNNLRMYFNKLFPNVDFTQDVLEFIMQGLVRTKFSFFSFKPEEFRCFLKQDSENKRIFLYFYLDKVK